MKKTIKKTAAVKPCEKKCATKKVCAKPCAKKAAAKAVTFTVHAEKGKAVYLAGSFNEWKSDAKKLAFKSGVYSTTVKLAPGTYEYKFVIDGMWCTDPENAEAVANDQGTFNSVITVK